MTSTHPDKHPDHYHTTTTRRRRAPMTASIVPPPFPVHSQNFWFEMESITEITSEPLLVLPTDGQIPQQLSRIRDPSQLQTPRPASPPELGMSENVAGGPHPPLDNDHLRILITLEDITNGLPPHADTCCTGMNVKNSSIEQFSNVASFIFKRISCLMHTSVFDAYAGTAVHDFLNGLMQFFSLRWVFTLEPLRALFHVYLLEMTFIGKIVKIEFYTGEMVSSISTLSERVPLMSRMTERLSARLSDAVSSDLATRLSNPAQWTLADRMLEDAPMGSSAPPGEARYAVQPATAPLVTPEDLHPAQNSMDEDPIDLEDDREPDYKRMKRGRQSGQKIELFTLLHLFLPDSYWTPRILPDWTRTGTNFMLADHHTNFVSQS
ncbi:uncharacterized protein LACBIDRAFT_333326 [Laccaria bicolor S238N-H82]|uniref:Predicted protein n=1 Tax=Laccaria bicolor (strain S238N-H82 / ATCC MYA-4686) TaxID=486041 RepID=B0DVK6_LACBS|nr:uncharacterized protein LACBIDRAFT_333326 [Laccaria bicolor S238N-H82]EDR01403.1 predicted protein [Laccaria bicolor S238N-H82]|eukprot:XP_001887948.1 predicted protein [Laccaria bicolor S238N-H82]